MKKLPKQKGGSLAFMPMKDDNFAERVIEYVLKCRDEELAGLTVERIAQTFKVSESYLTRRFKIEKNFTPGKFLFKERMFRAANILQKNRDLTIKSLAEQMGFLDYDYFIRIFKNYYGITPARYRYCKISAAS
jgi:two-component system response regulator YesN